MKIKTKLKGVKGFSVSGKHVSYLLESGNLVLDNKILASDYPSVEKFQGHYLPYYDAGTGQTKVADLKTGKITLLPKGVSLFLEDEDTDTHYGYSYIYSPSENKTTYTHFTFNLDENRIATKLEFDPDLNFIGREKEFLLFGAYESGFLKSVALYNTNSDKLAWRRDIMPADTAAAYGSLKFFIGFCAGSAIFSQEHNGITGIDLITGEISWQLTEITTPLLSEEGKKLNLLDYRRVKVNPERGILYAFTSNVYWEWEIRSRELTALYDHTAKARIAHHVYETLDYFMMNDTIYYSCGGQFLESEGKMIWPSVIAVNKITGEISDQIEFKPVSGVDQEVELFHDFQYGDNCFYLLDTNRNLWMIER